MHVTKYEQDWNDEGGRRLENGVPSFSKILGDPLPHIHVDRVAFLNRFLHHTLNRVIGLIESKLELLSENEHSKGHKTQNENHSDCVPCLSI